MLNLKQFIAEQDKTTTEWMSGLELAKQVPKTVVKHIHQSREHDILTNHDLAHGGNGHLHYRIHTKSYGNYKTQSVQAASSQKDKEGFTHHVTYDIIRRTARPRNHVKTSMERMITVPWHQKVE